MNAIEDKIAVLPSLTPRIAPWMRQVANDKVLQQQLFETYGSPINVHALDKFEKNIMAYQEVLDRHELEHLIFYARKANKSKALVAKAKATGIGVDTASFNELKQSLEVGVASDKLVSTAAIKNEDLIKLAILNDVVLILDNEDECRAVSQIATQLNKRAIVGFRVSGFYHAGEKLYSRFGFDVDSVTDFIIKNVGWDKEFDNLEYRGLHFHLDGYSTSQRGEALHQTLQIAEELRSEKFETLFIDIGGGFLMNYLEDEEEWNAFKTQLKDAVQGNRLPITFQNQGLGYEMIDGVLHGNLATYPYYNTIHGPQFLEEILDFINADKKTAAFRLKEQSIQLRMEPGRSLLDQVGITMAKVAFRKRDSEGSLLIGLEMNMSQLMSSSADFLLDPMVVHMQSKEDTGIEGYFVGAYCLERDVILKRKIALKQIPDIGDVVIFINTAGYMMHFFETEAHLFDLSKNLSMDTSKEQFGIDDFIDDTLIN
ncbi:Y4yA family PLP-dependent enzyme [Aquimarina intermedia]|uniref:Diaminopimelate decarboxylase n=1 Tax=Aquimarina intermedia TaxID=350814 RepID=A0A5S5BUY7_9FLAO|nr:Y4yA family PLP-dependent enzyme [Aquimarina intermedia]TYP69970.1 diaminopimelate decarboxylase [Aquimarina intermedia]